MDYSKLNNISASLQDVENATSIVENKLKDQIEQIERNAAISLNNLNDRLKVIKETDDKIELIGKKVIQKTNITAQLRNFNSSDLDDFINAGVNIYKSYYGNDFTPEMEEQIASEFRQMSKETCKVFESNLNISNLESDYSEIKYYTEENGEELDVQLVPSSSKLFFMVEDQTLNSLFIKNLPYYSDDSDPIATFEKETGDTYIYGVGGFTGDNSDVNTTKSLQTVLSELQDNNTFIDELQTEGIIKDVKVKEKDSDSYVSVLNNNIAQIDLSKTLEVNENNSLAIGNTNNIVGSDSIAFGVGVNIVGDRSFGFGEAYTSIFLTGDTNSNVYTAKLFNKTNSNGMNKVADVFKITHVNTYILETTNFTKVAKITAINWIDENNPLTVTLDTNLGDLTDGQYCIENISGIKTFSTGTFGNTGTYSTVFGNGNYNTGGYSLVSGYQNTNTFNYSNVLGYWNKNAEAGATLMGYANKNAGQYPVVLGLSNNNSGNYSVLLGKNNTNKCVNANIIGSANIVNETQFPSNILGMSNIVDANAQSFILGYSNHGTKGTYSPSSIACTFMLGHDLTTSRGGIALGWYNKDYDVSEQAKQNFLVVGQGTENQPLNTIEQKANGDLYVFGIGGFNGTNSDVNTIKTLQAKITELESRIAALEANNA